MPPLIVSEDDTSERLEERIGERTEERTSERSEQRSDEHPCVQESQPQSVDTAMDTNSSIMGSCSRLLQERCPACFGGTRFGRSFDTYVI